MPVRPRATQFQGLGLLLMVLVAVHPAAAQAVPESAPPVASHPVNPRLVVHVYVEPSFNRMADWRAGVDALKAEAEVRHLPISDEYTNGFVAWGGTLLVRVTPRILVGGELGAVQYQDRFAVTEQVGGLFA